MIEKGKKYEMETLTFLGWIGGDGAGRSCWDYFDRDGIYLGPDHEGVEPDFYFEGEPNQGKLMKQHVFEKAELGKAPFKFVSYEYKVYQACQGAPIQVGGSCDYCGTGIKHFHWITSADGNRFKVGSECVNKTGDNKLVSETKEGVRRVKAQIKRQKREEKRLEGQRNWCEKHGYGRVTFTEKSEIEKAKREEEKKRSNLIH